ncbi:MAG: hypothetical protein IJK89_00450 [Clostridia bacterium]|nr:hypothetical protein [Clostridia bacterium]
MNRIRKPKKKKISRGILIRNTVLILVLGAALGVFAKYLDELALDDRIWWHLIVEKLDLGNVFSGLPVWLVLTLTIAVFSRSPARAALNGFVFLLGMCLAYHAYTIVFAGFNPDRYMMIWYSLTAASPLLAVLCWYGRSAHNAAIVIDALIFAVLTASCFSVGWVYIGLNGAVNAALFAVAVIVMYQKPKQILIGVLGGVALAVAVTPLLPFSL